MFQCNAKLNFKSFIIEDKISEYLEEKNCIDVLDVKRRNNIFLNFLFLDGR